MKKKKTFQTRFEYINRLEDEYIKRWWDYIQKSWSLIDNYCFYWDWLRYTVLLEKYENERCSSYIKRRFRKLPKKYEKFFFEDIDEDEIRFWK